MSERKIYILLDFNAAIIINDGDAFFFDNLTSEVYPLDHYIFSQVHSLKPRMEFIDPNISYFRDFRESTMDKISHYLYNIPLLTDVISKYLNRIENNNVSRALQLMDSELSVTYKKNILSLIIRDLKENPKIIYGLYYWLYGKVLPAGFDPAAAAYLAQKKSHRLYRLFRGLKENSQFVGIVDSLLKKDTDLTPEKWAEIDEYFVSLGIYFTLSASLKFRSGYLFERAFEQFRQSTYGVSAFGKDFQNRIKDDLTKHYGITFEKEEDKLRFSFRSFYGGIYCFNFFFSPFEAIANYLKQGQFFENCFVHLTKEIPLKLSQKGRQDEEYIDLHLRNFKDEFYFISSLFKDYPALPNDLLNHAESVMKEVVNNNANKSEILIPWFKANIRMAGKDFKNAESNFLDYLERIEKYTENGYQLLSFNACFKLAICYLNSGNSKFIEAFKTCDEILHDSYYWDMPNNSGVNWRKSRFFNSLESELKRYYDPSRRRDRPSASKRKIDPDKNEGTDGGES